MADNASLPYDRLARTVLKHTLRLEPRENLIVECWNHGLDAARAFVYEARRMGARPIWLFEDEPNFWRSVSSLPKSKLGQVGDHEWAALREADAYVFVPGPGDIRKVRDLGFDKYREATAYNARWYREASKGRLRGARIGLGYVTEARAEAYGLDPDAWRAMVLDASLFPPRRLADRAKKLRRRLQGTDTVSVTAPNGTDLTFRLADRPIQVGDGVVDGPDLDAEENMENVPSGWIGCTVDERSAEGTVTFDRPVPYLGDWIRGITWTFEAGRLVAYDVKGNGEPMRRAIEGAKAEERRLGEVSFGLNPKARPGFLQDGIAAGTLRLAIGNNRDAGGRVKSSLEFGAHLSRATVTLGDAVVVRGGRLRL